MEWLRGFSYLSTLSTSFDNKVDFISQKKTSNKKIILNATNGIILKEI